MPLIDHLFYPTLSWDLLLDPSEPIPPLLLPPPWSPPQGVGANVFLSSAELAAVTSIVGRLPTPEEYLAHVSKIDTMGADIYRSVPAQALTLAP